MNIINAIQSNGLVASAASFAAGLACANIPLLVQKFVELPWISAWIRKNPATAKAIVAELEKDVDAVADAPATTPAAAPKP
jgi:hypothetical protein